jgi:hypothetical protein
MALAAVLLAQEYSRIAQVDPGTVKVGDNVTLTGEGLGKKRVVGVYLSSDTDDVATVIVEQSDTKLVIKIPKIKAGTYKFGLHVDKSMLIQPSSVIVE